MTMYMIFMNFRLAYCQSHPAAQKCTYLTRPSGEKQFDLFSIPSCCTPFGTGKMQIRGSTLKLQSCDSKHNPTTTSVTTQWPWASDRNRVRPSCLSVLAFSSIDLCRSGQNDNKQLASPPNIYATNIRNSNSNNKKEKE